MSPPKRAALTLKQFLLRQEVLKLYRSFFRTIRHLPDERQKLEVANWVRADFKANKDLPVENEDHIKHLFYNGEKMLKELKQSVDLSRA